MTSLMNFVLLALKFEYIRTEFSDKEDYFNHSDDALPDFVVDKALFITNKASGLSKNPPWKTEKTSEIKPTTTSRTTAKFNPVSVTFDTKINWVETPNFQVIRSNTNNDTINVFLPVWSSKATERTTRASTEATTRSTISYITRTRTISTTKTTTKTPISTARTTIATKLTPIYTSTSPVSLTTNIFTTTTPRFITYPTKDLLPFVPIPKLPITQTANDTKTGSTNTTIEKYSAAYTVTATQPSTGTMELITPTTVNTSSLRLFPSSYLNRMKPGTHTVNATHSTVFRDLTLKRNLRGKDGGLDDEDVKKQANNLQNDEVIQYQVLATEPFSKFLELLMKQLAIMDSNYAAKFIKTFERQFAVLLKTGGFDVLGPVTKTYIQDALYNFQFPTDHKQRLMSMVHNILANRHDTLRPELNAVLDYMDMLYSVKTEKNMERVLNEIVAYPNISKTAEEITEGFLEDVLVNPLKRISGTTQGNKLLAAISDIVMSKKPKLNARRVFTGSDSDFYKISKKSRGSLNYRSHTRRRPKVVIRKDHRNTLLPDQRGRKQTKGDRHRNKITVHRKDKGDINYFDSEKEKVNSIIEKKQKTKIYSLDFVKRRQEIPKYVRNVSTEVNYDDGNVGNEHVFRASYDNYKQHKMVNNPFRTRFYAKGRNDRFESVYTLKDTPNKASFQKTSPTTEATDTTVGLTTDEYKNIEHSLDNKSRHESNIYHKHELKSDTEAGKTEIKNFVRELITKGPSYGEDEFDGSDSDEEFTTITKTSHREKSKVTKAKSNEQSNSTKNVFRNKSSTPTYTKTTKSEFKETNISLKHFYFKPMIVQNKSGISNEFVSIEFDGEPNVIDFSMKVKLKKQTTLPTNYNNVTEKQKNAQTSETMASPTTTALRVFDPYKMDTYFKNVSVKREDKNGTADNESSSDDSSDSSSSDDSGESSLSLEKEKDQPQVFGKLHKTQNRVHTKHNLRSKKHRNSKKHHHKRKSKKHNGNHKHGNHRHGKHGKKHKHKYLKAYLKKVVHEKKKRMKHKMKQLKDKRIVGKNFEIAFDASSKGNDGDHLMDVTIVERTKYGKRATISIVNKDKRLTASDSIITSEEGDSKNTKTKKKEIGYFSTNGKHKRKHKVKKTATASTTVATEDFFNLDSIFRNSDHANQIRNDNNDNPEAVKVIKENGHQATDKANIRTNGNIEIPRPKDSRKNTKTSPNVNGFRNILKMTDENRKRNVLSPMLVQINKPNVASRYKAKFGKLQNDVGTVQRRFLPSQVFNDSEYTDEENELRNNLYDAFRHKDDVYYRRNMRHELPLIDQFKGDSDITDEEIILKQNIYKAIKEKNRRSNQ